MEKQNPPSLSDTTDRDSTIRPRNPSGLSSSEPSLKFPRPLGNRRLAHWVSSSHPDIMHVSGHTEEASYLAGSQYELVNNTDTESMDEFTPGSVSSDSPPSDDGFSLADTDHTNNDETIEFGEGPSGYEVVPSADSLGGALASSGTPLLAESAVSEGWPRDTPPGSETESNYDSSDSDEERGEDPSSGGPQTTRFSNPPGTMPCPALHPEQRRRSLEYAEESLTTPSASRHLLAPTEPQPKSSFASMMTHAFDIVKDSLLDPSMRQVSIAGVVLVCILSSFTAGFIAPKLMATPPPPHTTVTAINFQTVSTVSVYTSTVTISHVATTTVVQQQVQTVASCSPLDTFTNSESEDSSISAGLTSLREIVVVMPDTLKSFWLAKKALSIVVRRGDECISSLQKSVSEGIMLELPPSQRYGVVQVTVSTSRRPKINETFSVDLGRCPWTSGALCWGKWNAAVMDTVSGASRIVKSSAAAIHNLTVGMRQDSNAFSGFGAQAMERAFDVVGDASRYIKDAWDEQMRQGADKTDEHISAAVRKVEDMTDQMRIYVLNAQIRANLWWLQVQGQHQRHDRYRDNAAEFLGAQMAKLREHRRVRHQTPRRFSWGKTTEKKEKQEDRQKGRLPCYLGFAPWM